MELYRKSKLIRLEILGFFVCAALSVLFHFSYAWLGRRDWAAILFPVNESIWEHTKLSVLPYLLWSIVEWFLLRISWRRLLPAKTLALYAMVLTVIVFYYTYSGVWGKSVAWINIAIQMLAFLIGICVFLRTVSLPRIENWWLLGLFWLLLLLTAQIAFTANPPLWNLFRDPVTGQFGRIVRSTFSKIPV